MAKPVRSLLKDMFEKIQLQRKALDNIQCQVEHQEKLLSAALRQLDDGDQEPGPTKQQDDLIPARPHEEERVGNAVSFYNENVQHADLEAPDTATKGRRGSLIFNGNHDDLLTSTARANGAQAEQSLPSD